MRNLFLTIILCSVCLCLVGQTSRNDIGSQAFHIPQPDDPVITVYLSVHVIHPEAPDDSSGTWSPGQNKRHGAEALRRHINAVCNDAEGVRFSGQRRATYSLPAGTASFNHDTRMQYELRNIYYYPNNELYRKNAYFEHSAPEILAHINAIDSGRLKEALPIILTPSGLPFQSGPAIFLGHGPGDNGDPSWFAKILRHELAHAFGLLHPYWGSGGQCYPKGPSCCPENLACNDPDRLDDLFPRYNPLCEEWTNPKNKTSCNPPMNECKSCYETGSSDTTGPQTNNIMSDNFLQAKYPMTWISPLQQGRMRRALHFYSLRDFVKPAESSTQKPLIITRDEKWDFDIQMYRDIVISAPATVTITGRIAMPKNGRIIVNEGAKLILDSCEIYSWCHGKTRRGQWKGIEIRDDWKKKPVILNGKVLEKKKPRRSLKRSKHLRNTRSGIYKGS